jgi:mRNA-degrading endonuclease RelE of RelBE toxin-antitoxin system
MEKPRYKIMYTQRAVKQLASLDPQIKRGIKQMEELLATKPEQGKPLRYNLKGYRRMRYIDWRIIYRVDYAIENGVVVIVAIAHRKDIYERS